MVPEGATVLNMWNAAGGGRVFSLFECADPKAMIAWTIAWSDLMKMEIVPLVESADVLQLLKEKHKA